MNDSKLLVTAAWYGKECYLTIGQHGSSVSACIIFKSVDQITQLVDELVAAANRQSEETTDAK